MHLHPYFMHEPLRKQYSVEYRSLVGGTTFYIDNDNGNKNVEFELRTSNWKNGDEDDKQFTILVNGKSVVSKVHLHGMYSLV